MSDEKTEAPTSRRRSEARKKGQVVKSTEVNTALALLIGFWVLSASGARSGDAYTELMRYTFSHLATLEITPTSLQSGGMAVGSIMVQMLAPLVGALMVVGVTANLAQVGFLFSGQALKLDPKRIDPMSGLKRLFALRGVVELFKSLTKIMLVGIVVYTAIRDNFSALIATTHLNLDAAMASIIQVAIMVGIRVGVMMFFIAAADYIYQRYEHEKNLKMSKQEIREEMKSMENPQLKARIRARQRQMAMSRMMAAVPQADVVITNPTHYAVALKYDQKKMMAPQVVAKGKLLVAQRIKDLAKENNVPLVENKPLARGLFDKAEIGDSVPFEMYKAVAEVLAFVYRLKNRVVQNRF